MSSSNRDKNEGKLDQVKGKAKEAAGALTGSDSTKNEGRRDQDKGKLKRKKGSAKDLLK